MDRIKTLLIPIFSVLMLAPTIVSAQQDSSAVRNIGKAPGMCLSTQSENKCRFKSHERLTMQLSEESFIDKVVFSADDSFGEESCARVNVLVDGQEIAKDVDITEGGAEHSFSLGAQGKTIEIVPANDAEVNIHWVRVYGY